MHTSSGDRPTFYEMWDDRRRLSRVRIAAKRQPPGFIHYWQLYTLFKSSMVGNPELWNEPRRTGWLLSVVPPVPLAANHRRVSVNALQGSGPWDLPGYHVMWIDFRALVIGRRDLTCLSFAADGMFDPTLFRRVLTGLCGYLPQDKYCLADLHSDSLLRSIFETVPRRRLQRVLQGTIKDESLLGEVA